MLLDGTAPVPEVAELARFIASPDTGNFAAVRDWLREPLRDQVKLGLYKLAAELSRNLALG